MKIWILLIIAAFWFTGCSKHSPTVSKPKLKDLGIIQISDGITNQFDLGGDRVCLVSSRVCKDGKVIIGTTTNLFSGQRVVLTVVIEDRDSSGTTKRICNQQLVCIPDKWFGLFDTNFNIGLTLHMQP